MSPVPEPNEHGKELVTHLRQMRERVPITQEEAATALGGSRYQIHRIEQGRIPQRDELVAMLDLYRPSPQVAATCLVLWELAWPHSPHRIRGKRLRITSRRASNS
nr:helix-turn-helix transcriptional regulator [Kibdelosporangium sp. MJ126-NF4]CEL21311.1 hypothetical protein [Kibdelosporangium sp. MJ126-NF4]CTQ96122.1 hypothetical protein [Kibdelosporangium sp. MJ126-NF4]